MGETPIIRVRLHRYRNRPIGLIWQCGRAGGEISSGTRDDRDAERAAGRLEEQLEQGILPGRSEGLAITWADFVDRYEKEWLERLSHGSRNNWSVAKKHFAEICKPRRLSDVNKAMLSKFRAGLEKREITTKSAKSYYAALRAGLGWAESMDLMDKVPTIRHRKSVKTSTMMRKRVITAEEFERMIDAIPKVRKNDVAEFERFMRGLWHSSLRIDELNRLGWHRRCELHVDLSGKLPLIVFLGAQKNQSDTYLPAPPEFWDLVNRPGISRQGHVFPMPSRYGEQMTTSNLGRRIADIGKAANVVVDPRSGKCASAHDLRAACLTRIAAKATMSHTQALARHSDPKTTSQFYVRHRAEELAAAMGW
jgi:integrase